MTDTEKPAASTFDFKVPPHWDKWVAAAYLRMLGATQIEAAAAVGRADRTLRDWEADEERWLAAKKEAERKWLSDVTDQARGRLLRTLRDDVKSGDLALRVLERIDDKLLPATQKVEHSGELPMIVVKRGADE